MSWNMCSLVMLLLLLLLKILSPREQEVAQYYNADTMYHTI